MTDPRRYLNQLLHHLKENPPKAGKVTEVEVYHQDDCRKPDGGPCTCDPGPEIVTRHRGKP